MAIFLKTNPVYGIRCSVVLRTILVVFLSELSTEYSTLKLPIQVRVGATLRKYDDITLYTGVPVLFFTERGIEIEGCGVRFKQIYTHNYNLHRSIREGHTYIILKSVVNCFFDFCQASIIPTNNMADDLATAGYVAARLAEADIR